MRQIIAAVNPIKSSPGSIDERLKTTTQFMLRIEALHHP